MKGFTVQNGAKSGFVKEKKFEKTFTNFQIKAQPTGLYICDFTKNLKNFVNHLTNALQKNGNRVE